MDSNQINEKKNTLHELRKEIDDIDLAILNLVQKRVAIAAQMGLLKKTEGRAFRDTTREEQILANLENLNKATSSRIANRDLRVLFSKLMSICLRVQKEGRDV